MLQKLRDKTSGWIASLILGLLIIPFAFVGVNEYMTGGTASDVALVEAPPTWWESAPQWWPVSTLWQREEVTLDEFRTAFEQARQQQRQALGDAFDPREFESADNKRKVLEQLIDQKVLALGAQRAGIVVGDAAVQKMIMSEPAFQVDGKFSPEQYQMLLSSQVPAISPLQFQEQQRDRLRMMLVPQAISESDFVTEGEQARMWKVLGETRDIGMFGVEPEPGDQPLGDRLPQTRARIGARQNADQGDADLHGRQEAAGVGDELPRYLRAAAPALFRRLQPRVARRDDCELGHGEQAVEEDQHRDNRDVGPGERSHRACVRRIGARPLSALVIAHL